MTDKKTIDYRLADDSFSSGLRTEVVSLLLDGWQPFGSPMLGVTFGADVPHYVQAMVKYETKE